MKTGADSAQDDDDCEAGARVSRESLTTSSIVRDESDTHDNEAEAAEEEGSESNRSSLGRSGRDFQLV